MIRKQIKQFRISGRMARQCHVDHLEPNASPHLVTASWASCGTHVEMSSHLSVNFHQPLANFDHRSTDLQKYLEKRRRLGIEEKIASSGRSISNAAAGALMRISELKFVANYPESETLPEDVVLPLLAMPDTERK